MSVSYTMCSTKPLIIVILLSIYIQNIQCNDQGNEIKPANDLLNKTYPLATRDRDLRGVLEQIKNAADQIKNRALASWNYLKRVAESTRSDILKWVNNASQYAIKLEKSLEDELQSLLGRLESIIFGILGAGEKVQRCFIGEAETIASRLPEMSYKSAECMSDQIRKLQPIKGKQEKIVVNDTLFIADLERKLDACKTDKANYEECLNTVGDLVNEDIEEKRNEIQNTGIELRGLADNAVISLVDCAVRNIVDVVSFFGSEVIEIKNCVLGRRGIYLPIFQKTITGAV